MRLAIDIYEGDAIKPILRHVFFGDTNADVLAVVAAHKKYDTFFRAAMDTGRWKNSVLRVMTRWSND